MIIMYHHVSSVLVSCSFAQKSPEVPRSCQRHWCLGAEGRHIELERSRGNDQVLVTLHSTYHHISYISIYIYIYAIYIYHMTNIWETHERIIQNLWTIPSARWSREVSWVVTTLGTIQLWCDTGSGKSLCSRLITEDLVVSIKSPFTWIEKEWLFQANHSSLTHLDSLAPSMAAWVCTGLDVWDFDVEARAVLERAAEFNRLGSQAGWIAVGLDAEPFSLFSYWRPVEIMKKES